MTRRNLPKPRLLSRIKTFTGPAAFAFAVWSPTSMLLTGTSPAYAHDCKLIDYGTLPVEMSDSQATTVVKVNGQSTPFMLDTGAFFNMMSKANADALGLHHETAPFGLRGQGIGGSFALDLAKIKDFGILGMSLHNVEFLVGGSDTGMPLIGANLLDFADLDIDLAQGKLHMMKPEGRDCDQTAMAYWAGQNFQVVETHRGANSNDRRSFVTVQINGRPVKALLDTGADATLLTRKAAERVGVDLSSPGVKNSYMAHGVGAKSYRTWTAPIETFSVGTETIQRSQMQIMDGDIFGEADLLLGADFFLSHHLFIANSQHKIYFTYNGGRVFTFARSSQAGDKPEAGPASDSDGPKTADEYARRGKAHLSRGEAAAALADLDYAIRLAPGVAANYAIRARVHLELDQSDAIGSDLDKAIELDPNEIEPLLMRATRRVDHEDRVGAKLDIERARQLATPGSGQARSVANLYVAIDQPDAALPLLDDWIRAHRDDAMLGAALNERCWARGLTNQMLDDARDDCRRAIKRDGQKADYLDSLGLVELRLHHYADAIKAYQQAISEQPKVAWSHYGLGLAKIRSGRIDAGNADLAAAKTLNPKIEERFAWLNL